MKYKSQLKLEEGPTLIFHHNLSLDIIQSRHAKSIEHVVLFFTITFPQKSRSIESRKLEQCEYKAETN
jgi:hypothetical protein